MLVVENILEYKALKSSIVTIGTFDGVHIGHQKIITDMVKKGKKENLITILLTFFPHPRMVLQKDFNISMIDTVEEKKKIFEKLGIEVLIIQPFTKDFSRMTAVKFTRDILVNSLKVSKLMIGYDHRFGRNREATVENLKSYGLDYNFKVNEIPAQDIESISVSSTKIRNAIASGDIKLANKFLNRSFSLSGLIIRGDSIGREIGYPTANLKILENYKLKPQNGVYLVRTKIKKQIYFGMMNIGVRPTVGGTNKSLEIHFFNCKDNIYGKNVSIEIIKKIRDEEKFSSIDQLKIQLKKDEQFCLKLINK